MDSFSKEWYLIDLEVNVTCICMKERRKVVELEKKCCGFWFCFQSSFFVIHRGVLIV